MLFLPLIAGVVLALGAACAPTQPQSLPEPAPELSMAVRSLTSQLRSSSSAVAERVTPKSLVILYDRVMRDAALKDRVKADLLIELLQALGQHDLADIVTALAVQQLDSTLFPEPTTMAPASPIRLPESIITAVESFVETLNPNPKCRNPSALFNIVDPAVLADHLLSRSDDLQYELEDTRVVLALLRCGVRFKFLDYVKRVEKTAKDTVPLLAPAKFRHYLDAVRLFIERDRTDLARALFDLPLFCDQIRHDLDPDSSDGRTGFFIDLLADLIPQDSEEFFGFLCGVPFLPDILSHADHHRLLAKALKHTKPLIILQLFRIPTFGVFSDFVNSVMVLNAAFHKDQKRFAESLKTFQPLLDSGIFWMQFHDAEEALICYLRSRLTDDQTHFFRHLVNDTTVYFLKQELNRIVPVHPGPNQMKICQYLRDRLQPASVRRWF